MALELKDLTKSQLIALIQQRMIFRPPTQHDIAMIIWSGMTSKWKVEVDRVNAELRSLEGVGTPEARRRVRTLLLVDCVKNDRLSDKADRFYKKHLGRPVNEQST